MEIKMKISEDMKTAMKAGEKLKVSTLRLTMSAITYAEKDNKRELNEEETLEVIGREIKKRREAVEEYSKAGREDLAGKEREEAAILVVYMPAQMDEAEITAIVKGVIAETGAMGPGDLGKVMGAVIPKTKGRADGKRVNEIVRELLGQGA
jgi:uncharacterized protein YqeY